ncbi:MAG: antibiotic biosynthesis monooxygenase family protein [Pseudomonadota bacterium]
MDVIAKIVLKPEFQPEFESRLRALTPLTLTEDGCVRFEVYKDRDTNNVFWLIERWRSETDLESHYAQPYVRALIDHYDEWLAEPLTVVKLSPFQS